MIVEIRVATNSSKPRIEETPEGLKVRVKAKPVEGEANREIIERLAEHFNVKKSAVRILRGASSKRKTVEITE